MAAAEAPRSAGSSAGDPYIGSLISLTSKCEIRYEGILYNINTQESSIGLKNVRAFGTEGRKTDGPQIPASEKVYEYILFRGSDIKDLQVKSSPPVQSVPIHNDPAIIQSHYSRSPPSSTSFPLDGSGIDPDLSSHVDQVGLPRLPFQGNLPLYQTMGSLGSWGSSPAPPTADGSGLAIPGPMQIYWQGYYAPTGTLTHLQQQSLMRPAPGLSIPQSMHQPLQYPGGSTSLPSGSQGLQEPPFLHLLPTSTSTLGSTSATTVPSTLPPPQASSLAFGAVSSQMPTKITLSSSLPAAAVGANLSFAPQLTSRLESDGSSSQNMPAVVSSSPNLLPVSNVNYQTMFPPASMYGSFSSSMVETSSANVSFLPQSASNLGHIASVSQNMPASVSSNPRVVPVSHVNHQDMPQSGTSIVGYSNSSKAARPVHLVTPNQLLQPASSVVSSSQALQTSPEAVEVKPHEAKDKPLLPEPPLLHPVETKEPILPLPMPIRQKTNRAALHAHQISSRGHGRGRGNGFLQYPRPVAKFTGDFDFTAMNEKFNKDEVWGHLGKNKAQLSDVDGEVEEEDEILDQDGYEPSKSEPKPTYVKDDFFDAISCCTLDHGLRNGRPRFLEQMKMDAETFGDVSRHHPGVRGRGSGRGFHGGGRTRGGYYGNGRGYGYGGRGRGQSGPYRPF